METTNNTDKHEKYIDFKAHQLIIDKLKIGDRIIMTLNGVEKFNCVVLYAENSHVDISVQDKGIPISELTPAQLKQREIDQLQARLAELEQS